MKSFFSTNGCGAHVLVDGQYGSTGKGVLAAYLANEARVVGSHFSAALSNAGPNSGHTFYHGDEKHVLKQLPTFAVASHLLGDKCIAAILTAGAIIDPEILAAEAIRYPHLNIYVHPLAAVITPEDKEAEHTGSIAAVAGTRSGTGAALARKVMREHGCVFGSSPLTRYMPGNVHTMDAKEWPSVVNDFALTKRVFIEVSQGFSLGLNQRFYPKCTSRECTVAQALSDASVSPRHLAKVYMSVRAHPIRVGNVDGHSSGDWYPDQKETSWDALGVNPELTTVTKRVRRVASFSWRQLADAMAVNSPDFVFTNFLNYLSAAAAEGFVADMSTAVGGNVGVIPCYGPKSSDVAGVVW